VHVEIHVFLTSALVGGEWSASRSGSFTTGEGTSGPHWIGGWVSPRAGLDTTGTRTPNSVVQQVTIGYSDYAIPAPYIFEI
jgi:hypothetical protein